jgi:hypothetical protein
MVSYGETGKDFEYAFKTLKSAYKEVTGEEYNPDVLVADGSAAITRGFMNAFGLTEGTFKRVMCWAHAIRKIDSQLKRVKNEKTRLEIRREIFKVNMMT